LVHQLGSDYVEFKPAAAERTIAFTGDPFVPVIPAEVAEGAQVWWSGRGDTRMSTLTAALTVPAGGAQLSYRIWFEIEESYDYAYFSVSTDGGATWQTVALPSSRPDDPLGLNLGHGITGASGGWRTEQVDLSPWSGQAIQLRFWTVSDEAYNTPGLALDALAVMGAGALDWQGAGFVPISNRLPQDWELRGVLLPDGEEPQVTEVALSAGSGDWTIPANTRGVLIISGATPGTTEEAQYSYAVR
jgi:immune inhibitor A